MKKTKQSTVYVVGVLAAGNGHLLYLRDWPDSVMRSELDPDRCGFCESRGLKHNTW